MTAPLQSLVATGTKLWLDSIDPKLVELSKSQGATGATSNPIIVANIVKTGLMDGMIRELRKEGKSPEDVAWTVTNHLVSEAERVFMPVYEATKGNDGYVSFEVDPLLEDLKLGPPHKERVARYIELGKYWSKGHPNRMIKVPATPAGIDALEELAAAGVPLNVTLIFSEAQYNKAREAVWRGAQRLANRDRFKSVYSIFVSRLDVYTEEHVPALGVGQGWVGIVNAKRIWAKNKAFWADKGVKLDQEMIFASTGTKKPSDPKWKYVEAFAGSDIETNPPETNEAVAASGRSFTSKIAELPPKDVLDAIDKHVDFQKLEDFLMADGLKKFADPQKALLELISTK
ncbi:MAG TPA: transaldolase family protein [Oligoflexus sp.]|uniref:transaldolase family protein n=1 Tax=Oligoflexus sp. TaxID=1971216 RepID=UPI002D80446F|nr:transaldolase family protein [Oligoflexus sp.]HET9236918.1 transaldolase family protein [Oligoflexus sp.]